MPRLALLAGLLCSVALVPIANGAEAVPERQAGVVVFGATPGGVAAAVAAAGEGAQVLLVEETTHIGGMSSGGLSNTDFRTYESLGGFWRDFMNRVDRYYRETYGEGSPDHKAAWGGGFYEPKIARQVFEQMLAERQVKVLLRHQLKDVYIPFAADGRRVLAAAKFTNAADSKDVWLYGGVFVDATYEGDLMARAGVPYRVGCEAKVEYNEPSAFDEANPWVMAANFRICLSRDPGNRLPIPKPEGYDRSRFAKVIDLAKEGTIKTLDDIIRVRGIPNAKADFNDRMGAPIGIKLVNEIAAWPDGSRETRAAIYEQAKAQAQGMLFFLQNDPDVPDFLKKEVAEWGLPRDEYPDSGHWSPVLYLREGRRMVGARVFVERDTQPDGAGVRAPAQLTAIAIGDYSLNSHGVRRTDDGTLLGVLSKQVRPWQVPYECLLPKELDGLLVPVALSASHVGYSAIRMEPTWAALGQAAGVAAGMTLKERRSPREVELPRLQRRLHELGAMTFYTSDVPPSHTAFKAVQWFGNRGMFQDLVKADQARDWKLERITPDGQWTKAYPHHAMELDRALDPDLMKVWTDRAASTGLKLPADLPTPGSEKPVTRGQFLQALYKAVDAQYAPKPKPGTKPATRPAGTTRSL
jgi:hypothetical protein